MTELVSSWERMKLNMQDRLMDWFLRSKIWNGEAYISYYSSKTRGPVYPEITAYAISLSCVLYKRTGNGEFLDRAEKCAKYMIKNSRNGGIPSFSDNLLYAFDTGIFISSMFDLHELTHEKAYLKEAERSLSWLCFLWDGRQFAAVNEIPKNFDWFHVPSVHLAKLAIPLLKASKWLKEEKYAMVASKLLNRYRQLQTESGSFIVNEESGIVMTHPHCYATEGFLYAYHALEDQAFLEVARKASDWLCRTQNSDGSLYRCYSSQKMIKKEKLKTSDATAQATRIWKLLGVNQEGIDRAYRYLDGELAENGLTLFKKESTLGKLLSWRRETFSWPTFFYLHSLTLPYGNLEFCYELF